MSARSRTPARHKRIPQKPKPSTYHVPTEGQIAVIDWLTSLR